MKILIIEDDRATMLALKINLESSGYEIAEATTGMMGVEMGKKNDYDLVLLDIVLPEMNGIEVCRALRESGVLSPIIMLTAIQSKDTMIEGLDAGADDYLTKPVDQLELQARIRSIRRRFEKSTGSNVQRFADVEINQTTKAVTRAGLPITLTVTEFKLLSLFIEHPNKVFSRSELLESVWDIDFYLGTNVVDVYINYLRKKIDKPFETKLIHTAFGQGYVMKS
ncbi:MAG: response regulator transcription factor [Bacteroidota bacterium]